jgi:hypothetical protein
LAGPEKQYPGRDGTTTWKRAGRVAAVRPRIGQRTDHVGELQHRAWPAVQEQQRHRGRLFRTDVQEVDVCPSMVVVYCGIWLSRASCVRQSYQVCHRSASRCTTPSGIP